MKDWLATSRIGCPASASLLGVVGTCAILLGGLVAAVTEPLELTKGSWAAAYLVLVAGLSQCVMGAAQCAWGQNRSASWRGWLQFASWNLGNISVLLGALSGVEVLVYAGSGTLVIALFLAFTSIRLLERAPSRWPLIVYRVLLVLLTISIPVGVFLSAVRSG